MLFPHRKLVTIALALSSYVFISPSYAELACCSSNHFYVAANIGLFNLFDKETTTNPLTDTHYLSALGSQGGIYAGYDYYCCQDQISLGFEGFFNKTDINLTANQNYAPITTYSVNMRYNAGIRILPGYSFTPNTIAYLAIGYAYGRFKINDNGNFGLVNSQFSRGGFQFGVGLRTHLCNNLFLRGDILYTNYSSQTSQGVTTTIPVSTQPYQNRLRTIEENISLIYQFA